MLNEHINKREIRWDQSVFFKIAKVLVNNFSKSLEILDLLVIWLYNALTCVNYF